MSTRTGPAGNFTSTTLASADLNNMPNGIIGKTSTSSDESGYTTLANTTFGDITITPNTSRLLRVAFTITVANANASENIQVMITKDGSNFRRFDFPYGGAANAAIGYSNFAIDSAPTAASHRYRLQLGNSGAGSGSITLKGSTATCWFLIYDDGPSF